MLRDSTSNLAEYSGNDVFHHVDFPLAYSFSQSIHGVKTLLDGSYETAILPGFPGEVEIYDGGAWTMKQDTNWIRCSSHKCNFNNEALVQSTEKHHVKCCATSKPTDNFQTEPCFNHFFLNEQASNLQCPGKLSHKEAVEYCDDNGGRLCTSEELFAVKGIQSCTQDNGCGVESELIWTAYSYEYGPIDTGCLTSQVDPEISSKAIQSCDASMSFLIGSSLSVGSLGNLVKAIETDGPDKMPGLCCLDKATDSQFLGHDVRARVDVSSLFFFAIKCLTFSILFYHFRYHIYTVRSKES